MPTFAIVFNNEVRELREYPEQPVCKIIDGLPTVRPFIEKAPSASEKRGGYVIFDDRVERELLPKPVEEFKAERLATIEQMRLTKCKAGVNFGGKLIPSDKDALLLLQSAQMFIGKNPTATFRKAGLGEFNAAAIDAIINAVGNMQRPIFARESELYDAITAATTLAELDAIDIETGW